MHRRSMWNRRSTAKNHRLRPPHGQRGQIRFEIFAGAHSGRLVEVKASSLVSDTKDVISADLPGPRESRLADRFLNLRVPGFTRTAPRRAGLRVRPRW